MTELEKKQANCPYCHEPFQELSNQYITVAVAINSKEVSLRMMDSELYIDNVSINYCPVCGRLLER
ncbi:hypothetical protein [Paucilactobacillus kaifaensis]|uniref:hypothetical protein n=1 Tax=Paucilactobacillus kaifaensis TaxID=2559921 RepID=UPI0010F8F307|nr:hypothetical protein [Paucilactobacillus kaifaensis]